MNEFVTIQTYTYPYELAVTRSRLEAEGIDTFVKDELTALTNPLYSNAIGGIKLQVRQEDVEAALVILKEVNELSNASSPSPSSIQHHQGDLLCPYCGSDEIAKNKLSAAKIAWTILLLGFPLPFLNRARTYHCFTCYKDFTDK